MKLILTPHLNRIGQRTCSNSIPLFLLLSLLVLLIISTTPILAQTNSSSTTPLTFTLGEVKTVRTTWPSTTQDIMDGAKWIEYGIYVAILAIIPLILGLIGYMAGIIFYLFRCCGVCGGSKPDTTYQRKHLVIPTTILLLLFCGFIALAAVGIGFSAQGSANIRKTFTETLSFVNEANTTVMKVTTIGDTITAKLSALPDKLDPLLNKATEVVSPLGTISSIITSTTNQLQTFNSTNIVTMNARIAAINSNLNTLRANFSGVPTTTDIPDINSLVVPAVNSGVSALKSANSTIATAQADVVKNIANIKQQINATLSTQLTPAIGPALDGIKVQVNQLQSQIAPYLNQQVLQDASTYSSLAENIRIALSVIFFGWACIIYVFAFLGVIFRKACCVQTTTVLAFISAWVFFLFAIVQIPAYILITDTCTQGPKTLSLVGDQLIGQFNMTIKFQNVSSIMNSIATCGKNDSLLTAVLGKNYLTSLGIDAQLSSMTSTFQSQISSFDISSLTATAKNSVQNANISTIKTDYSTDIMSAKTKLTNATSSLGSLDGFSGFNQTLYNVAIDNLNAFTFPRTGKLYSYYNYTLFDPSTLPNPENTQGQNLKDAVAYQNDTYTAAYNDVVKFNNSVNAVSAGMNGLLSDFSAASSVMSSLSTLTSSIITQIDLLASNIQTFIANFPSDAMSFILTVATELVDSLASDVAQCSFMSSFVQTLGTNVCQGINMQLLISGVVCLAIGLLLNVGCLATLVLAKRVKYQSSHRVHPRVD
ncbi:hypothetical protein C9374_007221 [Naegleria lovaniensis]|uniref:Prominin-like protein n=1 Tax=Naegleria lovaniensis TaxID=51637 RepID=A0AA88H2X7_NAELO|nr:uncharacterized protein C9374_007221 [Naegleria lovaniensis]KAG2393690.1 hypothetical protein C9374_007221 [Naegleria lovaniensis]